MTKADFGREGWRKTMHTIGVLLLAAATAGDGFGYDKPYVGLKKLLRPHAVTHGARLGLLRGQVARRGRFGPEAVPARPARAAAPPNGRTCVR